MLVQIHRIYPFFQLLTPLSHSHLGRRRRRPVARDGWVFVCVDTSSSWAHACCIAIVSGQRREAALPQVGNPQECPLRRTTQIVVGGCSSSYHREILRCVWFLYNTLVQYSLPLLHMYALNMLYISLGCVRTVTLCMRIAISVEMLCRLGRSSDINGEVRGACDVDINPLEIIVRVSTRHVLMRHDTAVHKHRETKLTCPSKVDITKHSRTADWYLLASLPNNCLPVLLQGNKYLFVGSLVDTVTRFDVPPTPPC